MIVSLCGTHGTGKTTVLNQLKLDGEFCIEEATRKILPILGWNNPYQFISEYGIVFYESIIMNHWMWLTQVKKGKNGHNVYVDTSPIDNLAYYLLLRNEEEKKYENIFNKLCAFYCSYIDRYILFKCGVFPFVADEMRSKNYQIEHENIIIALMQKFGLTYYIVQEKETEGRISEIYTYIGGK